jgi:hypothetical protein
MIWKIELNKTIALAITMLVLFGGIFDFIITFQSNVIGDPPFSDNKKVNDDVGTTQYNPSIGVDSMGNIFVVWEDNRDGDWNIYFANSSDGGETWTNNKINSSSGNQSNPSLVVDSFNILYVVWEDDRNGDWDIYSANSTDGGKTWTYPNVKVNDDSVAWQINPSIAVDNSGNLYVTWDDDRNGDPDIYFSKSTDKGASWTVDKKVSTDTLGASQSNPTIAIDSSANIYIGWQDERNSILNSDIFFANSTDGGLTWTDPNKKVNTDATTKTQRYPSIAAGVPGSVYLVWEDYRGADADIYFAKSTNYGITWTDPNVGVNDTSPGHQFYPAIAEENGIISVVWEDLRESGVYGPDIYFANSTDGGVSWLIPNKRVNSDLNNVNQQKPSIVMSSTGIVYVVWEDERSGDRDVFFSKLEPPAVPTVDYIVLTDSPGGNALDNEYLTKEGSLTIYASGYSSLGTYLHLVDVNWSTSPSGLGTLSPDKGISTTFTAGSTPGSVVINGTNATNPSLTDNFALTIVSGTIDNIIITDSPNGTELTTITVQIGETVTAYASGYNSTSGDYIGLVDVEWSVDPLAAGSFDNDTGKSTTFTAEFAEGPITITGENLSKVPSVSDSFELIIEATVDYISLTNSPDGTPYTIETLNIGSSLIIYASGYNSTGPYFIGLVDVVWSQNQSKGLFDPTTGQSTTFTAIGPVGLVNITGGNTTLMVSDTFDIDILDLEIDYINITDVNKIILTTLNLNAGQEITIYAYAYNESYSPHMNLGLVDVNWTQSPELGTLSDVKGTSTTFTAGSAGGTTTITATNTTLDLSDDFEITIIPPEVDYIRIVDTSGTGTTEIADQTVSVGFTITGFAATFNESLGYISDSQVNWLVTNEDGASASTDPLSSSMTSIFSSGSNGGTATWSINDGQGHTDTVVFTIFPPTVDFIQIRDAPDGGGNVVTTATYNAGDTDTYYAAAYNRSVNYLPEVEAIWSCDDTSVGNVTSPGNSTIFTAQQVATDGTCTVTATYNGITNSTGVLTVQAIDTQKPNPPDQPTLEVKGKDKIEISWPANAEPDLDHYIIQRATNSEGPWVNITEVNKTTTSFTDTGLKSGTIYYYQIIAVDEAGNPSDPSPKVSAKTESEAGFPWILLLVIIIIIVIVIMLLLFVIMKKKM